jgi:hypothetical protein
MPLTPEAPLSDVVKLSTPLEVLDPYPVEIDI